jgi:hypothetical protein
MRQATVNASHKEDQNSQTKKRTPGHLRSLSLSTGGNWGQPRKKTRLN